MMEGFDVAELLEVGAGAEDVGAVDNLVVVEMVVAAENEVDETPRRFFGKFDVAGFAGVGEGDDDICALVAERGDERFRGLGSGFIDEVWRQSIDGYIQYKEKWTNLPLPLGQSYQPNLNPIARLQDQRLLTIGQCYILSQRRIQHVGQ
ncbi:MAG: hypothetical protein Q9211_002965 [Gyalolechia sp. 1 TL-2023]